MALLTNINGKFSVDTDGAASFNRIGASETTGFTFPSADGANGEVLKTNGLGTVSWLPDSNTGTVTGTGVANKVAYWTSATNIDDGPITFATNDSTFAGTVLIDGVSNYTGLTVKGSGASRPQIKFSNVNQGVLGQIYGTEANALVTTTIAGLEYQVRNANGTSGDHVFKSYNTAILTLNGATNAATFAGNLTLNQYLEISSTTAQYAYMNFGASAGYGWQLGKAPATGGVVDDQGFYLYNLNTGYQGVNLAVLKSGNVGIGTSSPTLKLDVASTNFGLPGTSGTTPVGFQRWGYTDRTWGGNEVLMGIINGGNYPAYIQCKVPTNYAQNRDLALNPQGGNVGIGTSSPDSKLHIEGSSGDNNLFAVGDVAIPTSGAEYGVAMIKTASTEFALNITSYSLTGKGVRIYNNGNNGPRTSFEILQGSGSKFIVDGIGNVGIGLTNPTDKLAVAGNISIPGAYKIYNGSASDSAGLTFPSSVFRIDGFSGITFNSSTTNIGSQTERMRITNTGNVGIGTTSPGSKLMISDANNRNFYDAQFKIEGSGYTAAHYLDGTEYMIHQNSNVRRIRMMSGTSISGVLLNPGATAWSSPSDERLKENIKPLDNVLDKIKDYRCVEYNFKNDKSKGKKIGFIAQDWEEDYPQIVDKDNKGLLDMKYTETIPVLLKAIQELKAEIEILKNK